MHKGKKGNLKAKLKNQFKETNIAMIFTISNIVIYFILSLYQISICASRDFVILVRLHTDCHETPMIPQMQLILQMSKATHY